MNSGLQNGKAKPKEITSRQKAFLEEAMSAVIGVDESDITFEKALEVYKLDCFACTEHDKPVHPKSTNCRDNPYCVNRLGIEKFQKLLKKEEATAAKVVKEQRRRDIDKMPCGLTNSGNFCYVNSFLQVWFNEPAFRQIVYDFRKSPTYVKTDACKIDIEQLMICLQRLFYFLEKSPYEDCSYHSNIINLLRLNNEQQDTLEFARMFLDALDRYLRLHPNGESTRNAVKRLYTGSTQNRLSCSCKQKNSVRSEDFDSLRLPIEGHKTMFEALDAVFASEKLDCGRCDQCDQIGGMVMHHSIEKLPNVLMIELMRYKIDSDGRKKIKTPLMYPNEFSAKLLLPSLSSQEEFDYELFAVLIHEGDNVTCGHYYDLIKASNGKWHKYNDESIEPLQKGPGHTFTDKKGKGLPSGKVPMELKYCYCLVYRKKGTMNDFRYPPRDFTDQWASQFETDFKGQTDEEIQKTEMRVSEVARRLDRLHQLFESLKTFADGYKLQSDAAFIPTNLLSDILNKEFVRAESIAQEVIDSPKNDVVDSLGFPSPNGNTPLSPRKSKRIKTLSVSSSGVEKEYVAQLLETHEMPVCAHGRVPIDTVLYGDVKVVSRAAAERLLARYAISIVKSANDVAIERTKLLTTADICLDCVKELKQDAIVQERIKDNITLAQSILRDKKSCSTYYWKNGLQAPGEHFFVSKKALVNYKVLAQKERQLQKDAAMPTKLIFKFVPNNTQNLPLAPELVPVGSISNGVKPKRGRPRKRPLEVDDSTDYSQVRANKLNFEMEQDDLPSECSVDVTDVVKDIVASVSSADMYNLINGEMNLQCEIGSSGIQSSRSDDSCCVLVNGRENSIALSSGTDDVAGTSVLSERPSSANSTGTASYDTESNHVEFNDQLRCKHGGINFGEFRNRVSPEEWHALSSAFCNSFSVNCNEEVCETCMRLIKGDDGGEVDVKEQMRDFSRRFIDVFHLISTREFLPGEIGTTYSYGLCSEFVKKMQTHFRRPSSRAPGTFPDICQSCIVCKPHNRPFCNLRGTDSDDIPSVLPLTHSEWNSICSAWAEVYPDQVVIPVNILPSGTPDEMCGPCHEEAIQRRLALDFSYLKGYIYVKTQADLGQLPESNGIKRTSRQQSKANLKIRLDSTDTIMDLKVQLYRKTGQSPNDQLLYNGGQVLSEDTMTLFEARISKDNVDKPLILIAQEVANESPKYDDCQPERGFADSALAH